MAHRCKPISPVVVAVFAAALVMSGCGSSDDDGITVNGHLITSADVDRELRAQESNKGYVAAASAGFDKSGKITPENSASWVQNQIIVQQLVDAEFARLHLEVKAKDRSDAVKNYEQQLVDPKTRKTFFHAFPKWFQDLVVDRTARRQVLARSIETKISDATIEAEYNKKYRCISHILVKTQAEADAIEKDLAAGSDFPTIAKAKSTDKGSAVNGGDLGCAPTTQYVKEFADAANAAAVGVVTKPVKSQFGWHILLVRKSAPISAELRTQIETQLKGAANPLEALLTKALEDATVVVPARFGVWVTKPSDAQPLPHLEPPGGTKTAVTVTTNAPAPNERPTSP